MTRDSASPSYLRFAEAVNRLDLTESGGEGLPELMKDMTQGQVSGKAENLTRGALEAAGEKLHDFVGGQKSAQRRQDEEG